MSGRRSRSRGGLRPTARDVVVVAAVLVAMAYLRQRGYTPEAAALIVIAAVCTLYLLRRIGRRIMHGAARR